MTQDDFEIVLNYLIKQSKMDAVVFITRTTKLTLHMTNILLLRNCDGNIGRKIYEVLPILPKHNVEQFDDFTLTVYINFKYGT